MKPFLDGLSQPEYVQVPVNPLPLYALAAGVLALVVGLAMRSRSAQVTALVVILSCALSAWLVYQYWGARIKEPSPRSRRPGGSPRRRDVHSAAEIGIDDFSFLERIAHKPRKKEFTSFRLILGSISFRAAS